VSFIYLLFVLGRSVGVRVAPFLFGGYSEKFAINRKKALRVPSYKPFLIGAIQSKRRGSPLFITATLCKIL
jgi:hypothetical protein